MVRGSSHRHFSNMQTLANSPQMLTMRWCIMKNKRRSGYSETSLVRWLWLQIALLKTSSNWNNRFIKIPRCQIFKCCMFVVGTVWISYSIENRVLFPLIGSSASIHTWPIWHTLFGWSRLFTTFLSLSIRKKWRNASIYRSMLYGLACKLKVIDTIQWMQCSAQINDFIKTSHEYVIQSGNGVHALGCVDLLFPKSMSTSIGLHRQMNMHFLDGRGYLHHEKWMSQYVPRGIYFNILISRPCTKMKRLIPNWVCVAGTA